MRTLQRRKAKRGMYSAGTQIYSRKINELDKNLIGDVKHPTPTSFDAEYNAFIAEQKLLKAKAELEAKKAAEEPVLAQVLAPEQSFVQTEVTEPAEPIKVEVVEEPVAEPVKKTPRKSKVEVTEEA